MKTFKNTLGIILMTAIIFTSCKDNNDNDDLFADNPATAQEFKDLRDQVLESMTQSFEFNTTEGFVTFTSANGVEIDINSSCLNIDGTTITGDIDVSFVEIFDKASMLLTNKPTMGTMPNGDKAMLISGGEFMIKLEKDGEEVETNCGLNLRIPASLTGGTDAAMLLWEGTIDENENLTWDEARADGTGGNGNLFAEGGQYYAFLNQFGWSNVDRFYNDARPKTTIKIAVPTGYDNQNCSVFLSYDGEETGLANMDTYDAGTKLFSEHYGQIPIGLECHLIFISEDDGMWKYAVKTVVIADNDIITFGVDELTTDTEAALVSVINGLP